MMIINHVQTVKTLIKVNHKKIADRIRSMQQVVDHIPMSGLDAPPLTQEDFESLAYFLLAKREESSVISDASKVFHRDGR